MRVSIQLPDSYPRRFVWFMECDKCRTTISEPKWSQAELPLDLFRERGWECGKITDTCPTCLAEGQAASCGDYSAPCNCDDLITHNSH